MHRFLVNGDLMEGKLIVIDEALTHQIRHVLRMQAGDMAVLFCDAKYKGYGHDFYLALEKFTEQSFEGTVTKKIKNDREPRIVLTVFQSIVKKDNLELIIEKCTEVGVSAFVPMVTERSVKLSFRAERMEGIVKEAAEQSGRARVPTIGGISNFNDALALAKENGGLNVFAHEKEARNQLGSLPLANQRINLFIGPEGGFSDNEVEKARSMGFFITLLSRRILRAETAAITASYFLLHRFGH